MPDHGQIYHTRAAEYELLVSREDYQANLIRKLREIVTLAGLEVIEFGAGTGRFTRLLGPYVKTIWVSDISQHMLSEATLRLGQTDLLNWRAVVADARQMPFPDRSRDLSIAGWALSHLLGANPDTWRDQIGQALSEMKRVLRPGGTAIVIETLGTGRKTPQPPSQILAAYYAILEDELGYASSWIRTDYRFQSLAEAEQSTRFFFGAELAEKVIRNNWHIVPECTGIWWSNA